MQLGMYTCIITGALVDVLASRYDVAAMEADSQINIAADITTAETAEPAAPWNLVRLSSKSTLNKKTPPNYYYNSIAGFGSGSSSLAAGLGLTSGAQPMSFLSIRACTPRTKTSPVDPSFLRRLASMDRRTRMDTGRSSPLWQAALNMCVVVGFIPCRLNVL
jgi:hypothetical protein